MKVNYTLYIFGLIFVIGLTVAVSYYKAPWEDDLSIEFAEKRVKEVLLEASRLSRVDEVQQSEVLITTNETAIKIAEAILFEVYGKEKILGERPYGVHKIDGYWVISGSVPKFYDGGGFEIILDARDARVMSIVHYR